MPPSRHADSPVASDERKTPTFRPIFEMGNLDHSRGAIVRIARRSSRRRFALNSVCVLAFIARQRVARQTAKPTSPRWTGSSPVSCSQVRFVILDMPLRGLFASDSRHSTAPSAATFLPFWTIEQLRGEAYPATCVRPKRHVWLGCALREAKRLRHPGLRMAHITA